MTSDDARRALGRIAGSGVFRDSENLQHLLHYLGEASLDGRAEQLKEYTVGVEALGRPVHYEPRVDSSARMLAGRLRRKLEEYYRDEGASDSVRITFPKGGFKLTFEPAGMSQPPVVGEVARWRLIAAVCAAAFLIAAVYGVLLQVRYGSTEPAADLSPEVEALWRPILDGRAPVVVSFGSPLFVDAGGWIMSRPPPPNDWSQGNSYAPLDPIKRLMGVNRIKPDYDYAGIGDVNGAFLIGKLLGGRSSQITLKRGAVLSWEDIQNNHFVFIGNGKNQEKVRYLLAQLEFSLDGEGVHCRARRAGEPADYLNSSGGSSGDVSSEYGLISFLPGSRKGRYMMILSADDTAAIWGVAEAVTNPRFAEPLTNRLRAGGRRLPKAFQAVIRIDLNAGVPVAMNYVVHHEIPPDRVPIR